MEWQARQGTAWYGESRRGQARPGTAGVAGLGTRCQGAASHGWAWQARRVKVWLGGDWRALAWQAWLSKARKARLGILSGERMEFSDEQLNAIVYAQEKLKEVSICAVELRKASENAVRCLESLMIDFQSKLHAIKTLQKLEHL